MALYHQIQLDQLTNSWAVKDDYSSNDFGQNEERNGDVTSGSYYVALPDGRVQRVTYSVDAYGGYQADVTYEGEAQVGCYINCSITCRSFFE